jgi:hypothetical protein
MLHHSFMHVSHLMFRVTRPFVRLLSMPIGAALIFGVTVYSPVMANEPRAPSSEVTAAAPSLDAIAQNTAGYSEAFPAGVPTTYAWCNGTTKPPGNNEPPSDYTAVMSLGSVYPKYGVPAYSNPDAKIIVANARTYVRLRATKEWIVVQDQSEDDIVGAHFEANAAKNSATEMKIEAQPDGATVIASPPPDHNDLLWMAKRGTYEPGSVDAVYVQMDMKTTDPKLKLVANVGADWWRGPDSPHGLANKRGAGNSNWIELSAEWSTLIFFSGSTSQIAADPPPPLAESPQATKPPRPRRAANTPSPCLRVLAPR